MENQNNVQKNWRTAEQKKELISKWQQGGMSRKEFCQENGIKYNSLVSWCKQFRDEKLSGGFSEVKIAARTDLYAQVHLPGGITIDFYQPVSGEFIRGLL
ncbi:MAG: transposase [Bacteroidia bacterium]